jgi:Fe-S oxidoreductase
VDVAKLKAEFLQHYYDEHGVPFRSKLIAHFTASARLGSVWPGAYNFFVRNRIISGLIKSVSGFAKDRSLPTLNKLTLQQWFSASRSKSKGSVGKVYLFCDEFTNYNDGEVGRAAVTLLEKLGYEVEIPSHLESGRTWLSKGLLRKAQQIAQRNISMLAPLIHDQAPLVGLEPSAILTFRDEYIDLAPDDQLEQARNLAKNVFTIEEFLAREIKAGKIGRELFTKEKRHIKLHGHCQQKALSSIQPSVELLSLPENYSVEVIPSGCCGMAGSFGYEKEHYSLSMAIGELVLFPAVRKATAATLLAAAGTSCRHQIKDGTGKIAQHPVQILCDALVH